MVGEKPPLLLSSVNAKQLGVGGLGFVDAALPGGDLAAVAESEGSEDLDARVAGVDLQWRIGMGRERRVDVVDAVVEHAEELVQFAAHLRVRPQQVDAPPAGWSRG